MILFSKSIRFKPSTPLRKMNIKFLSVILLLFCSVFTSSCTNAQASPQSVDVYQSLDGELQKLNSVTLEDMTFVVNLTVQYLEVHRGQPNGESTLVCRFPCSTGPGKYAMIPPGMKTYIYETGPGSEGNRPSYQSGGVMRHCLRLKMDNPDGSEAYVGMHSASGEYVPRIPTTHGCIRLPDRVANALFLKIWDGKPGKVKGGVKRQVPVLFVGVTPTFQF